MRLKWIFNSERHSAGEKSFRTAAPFAFMILQQIFFCAFSLIHCCQYAEAVFFSYAEMSSSCENNTEISRNQNVERLLEAALMSKNFSLLQHNSRSTRLQQPSFQRLQQLVATAQMIGLYFHSVFMQDGRWQYSRNHVFQLYVKASIPVRAGPVSVS